MPFIMKNLWLVALVVVSGGMLVWPMLRRGALGIPDVSPNEVVILINREHALVLDVRNNDEFATGHITNARQIPLDQLQSRLGELGKFRDKAIVVNCQGGVRSAKACAVLKNQGFSRVHNLKGGISAWIEAKMPVTRE